MFAIVNDNDSNLHEKLRSQCGVRLNLDLFAILIKPLTEAIEASDLQSTDLNTLSGQIVAEEDLLVTIDWIVGLSSMDGAVLLDRNLKLHGAGMEVSCANSKEGPDVPLIDASGGTKSYSWIMKNLGMRHRAAYRCAAEHDNSIIFVISQDGGLTVFAQSSGQVCVIQGLKPIFWSGLH